MARPKGYRFSAGLAGSNIIRVGQDPDIFSYTTISSAVSAACPGDLILVAPGTYTMTTPVAVDVPVTIKGDGPAGSVVITSALTTQTMYIIEPSVANGSLVNVILENLFIVNTSTGTALLIDTYGGAALPLYVDIINCSIVNTSTGYAIESLQSEATAHLYLNIGSTNLDILGKSYFTQLLADDQTNIYGMYCNGVFAISADATASIFNMAHCVYASQAQTTGGDAAKILNYSGNIYAASGFAGAMTKGDAGDFDALGTESAVLYA